MTEHSDKTKGRSLNRRRFIATGLTSLPLLSIRRFSKSTVEEETPGKQEVPLSRSVKALAFDVFGTVVDWRSSIIREGQLLTKMKGLQVDWARFADEWRDGYAPAMDRVRKHEIPWSNIDGLNRLILNDLMKKYSINGLSEEEINNLNRVWHRLMPWSDSVSGLNRLRSRYIMATLSNGNMSLLVDMARNAGLPWDCVLSAELSGHYKPDPEVYAMAARLLDLSPEQVMMVAMHPDDLRAARKVGLKTGYVLRPLERGPDRPYKPAPDTEFDVIATDFMDLANKLGA